MKTPILDIAKVVRSKNSGPFELTMDIIFKDKASFDKVKAAQAVNKAVVAKAYSIPETAIRNVIYFDPAWAFRCRCAYSCRLRCPSGCRHTA